MPTVKIAEYIDKSCRHTDHYPSAKNAQKKGVYRHTCPQCEQQTEFTIYNDGVCDLVFSHTYFNYIRHGKPWNPTWNQE